MINQYKFYKLRYILAYHWSFLLYEIIFYIHHKLWISDCDNLLNISNLYGFDNLKISNCISLQSVNIGFSKVKRMELRHLPLAKLHIKASALENLYINCVDFLNNSVVEFFL